MLSFTIPEHDEELIQVHKIFVVAVMCECERNIAIFSYPMKGLRKNHLLGHDTIANDDALSLISDGSYGIWNM